MRWLLLALTLMISACTYLPGSRHLIVSNQQSLPEPTLHYLGVGGWLVHWKGEGVLLAPSFSNPGGLGIRGLPPLRVKANPQRIDALMPSASDVKMLLVGHAHYDHLLDVPRVMHIHTPKATVYGSQTVGHILHAGKVDARRIKVLVADEIANPYQPSRRGTWFYSNGQSAKDGTRPQGPTPGMIRAMPIHSEHAGHAFGINFIQGQYDHPLGTLPQSLFGWRLGEVTLAWLIDLLDENGKPVYRIHYQDSAATPPLGFPPLIADGKRIDVEILCAASWDQVHNYPAALLRITQPRTLVLGHWENFFASDPKKPARTIPLQGYKGLLKQLPHYTPVIPEPFSQVPLPPHE
ncbi:MBL fold metallo-hydrolase [Pseudomonas donghuensis]|uniref:MBL fold metallo-hydrolase n=1 Tax=Pseudomonas donghuensis TaxID=1163398 RepID=UPI002160DB28|nr:MBL fold metallo-hydrolase [Pseudomonas donghuensis]UVL27648.1 MBL fold metallo-hydrolase [Pseudomonas donghuensis]